MGRISWGSQWAYPYFQDYEGDGVQWIRIRAIWSLYLPILMVYVKTTIVEYFEEHFDVITSRCGKQTFICDDRLYGLAERD